MYFMLHVVKRLKSYVRYVSLCLILSMSNLLFSIQLLIYTLNLSHFIFRTFLHQLNSIRYNLLCMFYLYCIFMCFLFYNNSSLSWFILWSRTLDSFCSPLYSSSRLPYDEDRFACISSIELTRRFYSACSWKIKSALNIKGDSGRRWDQGAIIKCLSVMTKPKNLWYITRQQCSNKKTAKNGHSSSWLLWWSYTVREQNSRRPCYECEWKKEAINLIRRKQFWISSKIMKQSKLWKLVFFG